MSTIERAPAVAQTTCGAPRAFSANSLFANHGPAGDPGNMQSERTDPFLSSREQGGKGCLLTGGDDALEGLLRKDIPECIERGIVLKDLEHAQRMGSYEFIEQHAPQGAHA